MILLFRCPQPTCHGRIQISPNAPESGSARCPHCGATAKINVSEALLRGDVTQCAVCNGAEFFIRKDFPQKLGLTLVMVFGIVASVFFYYKNVLATFASLAALVVIDAAIYLFVGRVTVCYRCRAEYRNTVYNSDHHGFDLATSEKYEETAGKVPAPPLENS
jgi:hypothetical protein